MRYRLEIGEEALAQLRSLPREWRRQVGWRLDRLQTDLTGDIKKLSGTSGNYRLRVGSLRILFTLENDLIFIHMVKDRKDAYRD